ncbi:ABC transporter permease [Inquilinus sp. YAF38]|uniref:ABC transporter permease n=1 Tax=Inquilinus sp. YAF38 TaxID=3233084 RepID=UPI003F905881
MISLPFLFDQVMPALLAAIPVTLALFGLSAAASLLLGIPLGLAMAWGPKPLRWAVRSYSLVIRGTPLLVQIYILYYGFGHLVPASWMRHGWAAPYLRDAFWYALVALSLNETAYVAELFRGAIRGVPEGEVEAARAFGMTRGQAFRRIVLPRAIGLCLPALANEAVLLLKSTVLASTITVFDVLGTANTLRSRSFRVYEPLIGAALIYIVLVGLLTLACSWVERRLNPQLRPAPDGPRGRRKGYRGGPAVPRPDGGSA